MAASPTEDLRLVWRKSTRTNANNNDCVEVAALRADVAIRDSKHPDGPRLRFSRSELRTFATRLKG